MPLRTASPLRPALQLPLLLLLQVYSILPAALACTTSVVGRGATFDGSVLSSHSNDGDGGIAGNLVKIAAANHTATERRMVSGGTIPQVAHTFGYLTKPGGYASLSEQGVALAESTCNAVFQGNRSRGVLDIVDLSELALERSTSARGAIQVMGDLAEQYGYYDAGESLLVTDALEAWIFHILPDPSGSSALWVRARFCRGAEDSRVGVWLSCASVCAGGAGERAT
jgi:dipeptidase